MRKSDRRKPTPGGVSQARGALAKPGERFVVERGKWIYRLFW